MDEILLLLLLITLMQGIYLKQTTFLVYVRSLLHSSVAGSQECKSHWPSNYSQLPEKLFNYTAYIKY